MVHEIVRDGQRLAVGETTEIGQAAALPVAAPLLRFHRLSNGDVVVIAAGAATLDGTPLLGHLGIIAWGSGAVLRAAGERVEVRWQAAGTRRPAQAGERCRVCFGACAAGEPVTLCACAAVFHDACDRVRINCPGCGAPPQGRPA